MSKDYSTYLIHVSGLVQGVGFRPFIWRLAHAMNLQGCVFNHAQGVQVELNASPSELTEFVAQMQAQLPALAKIEHLEVSPHTQTDYVGFNIVATQQGQVSTGCAPDAGTCQHCLTELFDPDNRRYRYPFINCTDCGPRLSIIKQIPYDREFTTMAAFTQCPECHREYTDPSDRRFHAQPNACEVCGPKVWLEDRQGNQLSVEDDFAHLAWALGQGQILAVKGLGGFHLACDATDPKVIDRLRQRKQRPDKAFALMVKDLEVLRQYAQVTPFAEQFLSSHAAPVVLLNALENPEKTIADNIAPGQYQLGFMLPYTPIHHLLFETLDTPVVMTSGNRSGSPQAIDNTDAREQLSSIADVFLMHNRPIQNRVDDSVIRPLGEQAHFLRRARGYAPSTLKLPAGFEKAPDLVALGGELKNTLCFLQGGKAILSQHLGDLEDFKTYEQYQKTLNLYQNLYQFESSLYVADRHPSYLSSQFADELAEKGQQVIKVQHHHAHLASCLGENEQPLTADPVLGICLDGTGYGLDHSLWGGEFLYGNYQEFARLAYIKPFPLVGGTQAIREPWRCLYGQLKQAFPETDPQQFQHIFKPLASPQCATFAKMLEKQLNCPMTSSAGRLFDAVAAALAVHANEFNYKGNYKGQAISYEGQAAIELETLASSVATDVEPYPFALVDGQIDPAPFWQALLADLEQGQRSTAQMALAFHKGFVASLVETAISLQQHNCFHKVALSGGVMQNAIVFRRLQSQLQAAGFEVLTQQQLPSNDAGLAYGQALIAAAQCIQA